MKDKGTSGEENRYTDVTTAFLTVFPSFASEISFILERTIADISWGVKVFSSPR